MMSCSIRSRVGLFCRTLFESFPDYTTVSNIGQFWYVSYQILGVSNTILTL